MIPDEVIAERALRLLALGMSVPEVARALSRPPRHLLTPDDLRGTLALVAPRLRDADGDDELRTRAVAVVERLITERRVVADARDGEALRWATAVMQQAHH